MTSRGLRALAAIPVYLLAALFLLPGALCLALSAGAVAVALRVHGRAAPPDLFRSWPFSPGPKVRHAAPPRKERVHGR